MQRPGQLQQQVDDGEVVARGHAARLRAEVDHSDGMTKPQRQPTGPPEGGQVEGGGGHVEPVRFTVIPGGRRRGGGASDGEVERG